MSAIITDQLRILNAKEFVASVASTSSSYYTFVGLPNATQISSTWDISPPDPRDNFDEENNYWDTMIALKKIDKSDIALVVPKRFGYLEQLMICIVMIIVFQSKQGQGPLIYILLDIF